MYGRKFCPNSDYGGKPLSKRFLRLANGTTPHFPASVNRHSVALGRYGLLLKNISMKNNMLFLAAALFVFGCNTNKSTNKAAKAEDGWISIFDGKTLNGWKAVENPATFSVADGAIMVHGPRAHLFYDGAVNNHDFKNFDWKATVKTMPGANSGMFIHTAYQNTGWPGKGYEIQVNQTHTDWRKTGSVYAMQDVKETYVKDGDWYTEQITVQGNKVTIRINDKIINEYAEPDSVSQSNSRKKLSSGTVALQGHDPKSIVYFKDIMIRPLP